MKVFPFRYILLLYAIQRGLSDRIICTNHAVYYIVNIICDSISRFHVLHKNRRKLHS